MTEETEDKVHPAVRLLITRFKSNPEEFLSLHRWHRILQDYKDHWSVEDHAAWTECQREYFLEQMHQEIMKELLKDPAEEEEKRQKALQIQFNYLQQQAAAQGLHPYYQHGLLGAAVAAPTPPVKSSLWTGLFGK